MKVLYFYSGMTSVEFLLNKQYQMDKEEYDFQFFLINVDKRNVAKFIKLNPVAERVYFQNNLSETIKTTLMNSYAHCTELRSTKEQDVAEKIWKDFTKQWKVKTVFLINRQQYDIVPFTGGALEVKEVFRKGNYYQSKYPHYVNQSFATKEEAEAKALTLMQAEIESQQQSVQSYQRRIQTCQERISFLQKEQQIRLLQSPSQS